MPNQSPAQFSEANNVSYTSFISWRVSCSNHGEVSVPLISLVFATTLDNKKKYTYFREQTTHKNHSLVPKMSFSKASEKEIKILLHKIS